MEIYGTLSTILSFVIIPLLAACGIFKPKLSDGLLEKLFQRNFAKNSIVFHAVSVGEVNAIVNLVKKTRETFSDAQIVVTTGTKTGQAEALKKLSDVANVITYFPLDFPFCVNRFLKQLNPKAVFIMETELWPNFIHISSKKKIPLFLINARISDRTFKSYKKLSVFFKPVLRSFSGIWTQSESDNKKFVEIGANPLTTRVMGNLKFDIKKPECDIDFKQAKNRVIIAGSLHRGEAEIILPTFCKLKKIFSDLKLLIAPRHPEIFAETFALCEKTGLPCGKRSLGNDFEQNEIILADTMGELSKSYEIAEIAFIGGSFAKIGGHNPLEATIFSKPVVSGSSVNNFKDIYAILTRAGAAKIVQSQQELKNYLEKLLADNAFYESCVKTCENVFAENKGALDFVLKNLETILTQ